MKNWKETDKQKKQMRKEHKTTVTLMIAGICLLAGRSVVAAETKDLTLEQRVAQLFFVTPDQLSGVDGTTAAGKSRKELLKTARLAALFLWKIIFYQRTR